MLSSTSTLPNYVLRFIKCMENDKYEKSGKENMSSWACSDTLNEWNSVVVIILPHFPFIHHVYDVAEIQ